MVSHFQMLKCKLEPPPLPGWGNKGENYGKGRWTQTQSHRKARIRGTKGELYLKAVYTNQKQTNADEKQSSNQGRDKVAKQKIQSSNQGKSSNQTWKKCKKNPKPTK